MYYKREPRPRVSVIGARLEELAARRKGGQGRREAVDRKLKW
jgi:hypothetical protein